MALGIQRDIFMAAENYSRYQQSVIRNYYNNKDNVSLQRAQELLTDLYLAEGKKREKVWESLFMHLERLGVPADQLQHLKESNNPELIAQLIQKKIWESCYCTTAYPRGKPLRPSSELFSNGMLCLSAVAFPTLGRPSASLVQTNSSRFESDAIDGCATGGGRTKCEVCTTYESGNEPIRNSR